MTLRAFRIPDTLWGRVVAKANGLMSVSAIVRRLLEMWVNDEVDLSRK